MKHPSQVANIRVGSLCLPSSLQGLVAPMRLGLQVFFSLRWIMRLRPGLNEAEAETWGVTQTDSMILNRRLSLGGAKYLAVTCPRLEPESGRAGFEALLGGTQAAFLPHCAASP